jgi:GNAT superfamily N-acetyltransferase
LGRSRGHGASAMQNIQFAVETYAQVAEDIKPLIERQWRELALFEDVPLDPDWGLYRTLSISGFLIIFTARDEGRLIGYALYFMRAHHHYKSTSWAQCDIIWIDPECRRRSIGTQLFDFVEATLRDRGVVVIQHETKSAHPELAHLLHARDYAPIATMFTKKLS